jgi:uncharacterized protein (DUF2267 family)/pterin-4a-carbinolamine dehydratase
VIQYENFVAGVAERAGLADTDHARDAAREVLASVALCVPPARRDRLGAELPATLRTAIEVPGQREPEFVESRDIVVEVSERLHQPAERARYLAQAVLSALCAADPGTGDALARELGPRFADLFAAPGDGPPPERAGSAAEPGIPIQLSAEQVRAALAGLTNWSGGTDAISRTVALPADRHAPLLNRIHRAERAVNHRVQVAQRDDTLTFTLRTRGSGDVTNLDIELAERIDAAIVDVGSGG